MHDSSRGDGLRAALAAVSQRIDEIATALDSPSTELSRPPQELIDGVREKLEDLSELAAVSVDHLQRQAAYAAWDRRFGLDGWAEREGKLTAKLRRHADRGTAEWFETWLEALAAGEWDEAWRTLRLQAPLAAWAVWLPDRAAAIQLAVQLAPSQPKAAAAQIATLVEALLGRIRNRQEGETALDRLAKASVSGRIDLLLVVARVLALAEDDAAAPLVAQARSLLGSVRPGTEIATEDRIAAMESFLARHGVSPGRAPSSDGPHTGTTSELSGIHEFVESRKREGAAAEGEAATEPADDPSLLPAVQALVDGLPSVAGAQGALTMLLEPPSGELVISLATRLLTEGQVGEADDVCSGLEPIDLSPGLRGPALRLLVAIADALELTDVELSDELLTLGSRAIWAEESALARDLFERALSLNPDDPEAMRRLADALLVTAGSTESATELADLHRALELADRAAEIEPVTAEMAWTYRMVRLVHQSLYRLESPPSGARPWESLRASVASFAFESADAEAWRSVVADLRSVGLLHSAYWLAKQAHAHMPTLGTSWEVFYAAINTRRIPEALAMLPDEAEAGEPEEWLAAVHGLALACIDNDEAEQWMVVPLQTGRIVYQEWMAEFRTRRGWSSAGELWDLIAANAIAADYDEAAYAAYAALYRKHLERVHSIADTLIDGERLLLSWSPGTWATSVADIIGTNGRDGWEGLRAAFDRMVVPQDAELNRTLTHRMLVQPKPGSDLPDLPAITARVDEIADASISAARAWIDDDDPLVTLAGELRWARKLLGNEIVDQVIDDFQRIVVDVVTAMPPAAPTQDEDGAGASEAGAADLSNADALPSSVPTPFDGANTPIRAYLPTSWLADWKDRELDHELFVRGLPLARAALIRAGSTTVQRAVRIGTDDMYETHMVEISPSGFTVPGDSVFFDGVDGWDGWYCSEAWLAGLSPARRASARALADVDIYRIDAPGDSLDRLSSWSAAETIARRILDVAERAAQAEPWLYGDQSDVSEPIPAQPEELERESEV